MRRRSGFLTPSFLISSDFGFTPSVPYFQVIDDTKDAQVNLYKYQYRGAAVETKYRQLWDQSALHANMYTARVETYKAEREMVGAVDASFTSNIGNDWNVTTRLTRSSQDTFLRRYKFNSETSLKSSATAERIISDRYYYVEASDRQSLTTENKNTNEPTILPHVFYEKIQEGLRPQQQFRPKSAACNSTTTKIMTTRVGAPFSRLQKTSLTQGIGNYNASLMANYYEMHSQPGTASTKLECCAPTLLYHSVGACRLPFPVLGVWR